MATEPMNWNVVVLGAWNIAILTPDGVRRRLYQLPESTPVNVEVAIDRPGPHRVRHDGLIVTASSGVLDVSVDQCDSSSIGCASKLACRALESLPETPVYSAGVNMRYQVSEVSDELLELTRMSLDDELSDGGYEIEGRKVSRALVFKPGVINVDLIQGQDAEGKLVFNFHLDSSDHSALCDWLGRTNEFFDKAKALLSIMKVSAPQGEEANG